jgi:hypothetical protein
MDIIPNYWKGDISDIEQAVSTLRKGVAEKICTSPGGRIVYRIFYGKNNDLHRTANISSALGAGDFKCYADKSGSGYRPVLFLAGCIHGAEFEGTVALLNLINVLETGKDFSDKPWPKLQEIAKSANLILIPCANPDGRSRVALKSMAGQTFDKLRYYDQGTWKDGSLCGYPECKKIHPIKNAAGFLGGYFNDDGVNLMHDNFFTKKAAETEAILKTAEEFAPDFTVLLHGGDNGFNVILQPAYTSYSAREKIIAFDKSLSSRCFSEGLKYQKYTESQNENNSLLRSFNLTSAVHHVCGGPCITYESNQGLDYINPERNKIALSHDEIYRHHMILFEELGAFILRDENARHKN